MNLERMAMTPAAACIQGSSARSSRLSDRPVMRGERRSIAGSRQSFEQIACVISALAMARRLGSGFAPRSIQPMLRARRMPSAAI